MRKVGQRWEEGLGRKRAGAELWSPSPLFSMKRMGADDLPELLLLMSNLFAVFSEKHGLGSGLKAHCG